MVPRNKGSSVVLIFITLHPAESLCTQQNVVHKYIHFQIIPYLQEIHLHKLHGYIRFRFCQLKNRKKRKIVLNHYLWFYVIFGAFRPLKISYTHHFHYLYSCKKCTCICVIVCGFVGQQLYFT